MQLSEIQSKIYSLTNTDSTSFPNDKMVIDLNIWQNKVVSMILDSQDESDYDDTYGHGDYASGTYPLTINRDYQIAQSEGVINIKSVSISYDGINYYRATPVDIASLDIANAPATATTQQATIDQDFVKTSPQYDYKFNSLFIYPKPSQADVDAGGKIYVEWSRNAKEITLSELSTGTKVPSFDTAFHEMLAYGPAYEYALSKQLPIATFCKQQLVESESRLRRQYGSKVKDRQTFMKPSDDIIHGYK
jgi:hypothetical protein